jgi:hypothetical protein
MGTTLAVKSSDLQGGVMAEQESVSVDERVARLIQAARELIDAYERKSTANEHFLKLKAAVEALGGTSGQPRADQDPGPGNRADPVIAGPHRQSGVGRLEPNEGQASSAPSPLRRPCSRG